jgi:hypothetical protein
MDAYRGTLEVCVFDATVATSLQSEAGIICRMELLDRVLGVAAIVTVLFLVLAGPVIFVVWRRNRKKRA